MGKIKGYRERLKQLDKWEPFLLKESGLPGRRANIELARAVAEEGDEDTFNYFLSFDASQAPVNSPYEFLFFCGVLGLGKKLAQGDRDTLERLRLFAEDPRWRVREAVAMALQRFGKVDMGALLSEMENWSKGTDWQKRAAAAGLCEPDLLKDEEQVGRVLNILNQITGSMERSAGPRSESFRALRKGMGYCWSVAVVADPKKGKIMMTRWLRSDNRDIRWMMKENLRKKRLERMDSEWVRSCWNAIERGEKK